MSFVASNSKKHALKVKILSPRVYPFSKMTVKWRGLTWPGKSPKFNLHHLRKISAGFKMAVQTPKLGICWYYIMLICWHRLLECKYNRTCRKKYCNGFIKGYFCSGDDELYTKWNDIWSNYYGATAFVLYNWYTSLPIKIASLYISKEDKWHKAFYYIWI